jgi:diketogulonate reductase-like aldo/keto reductase
VIREPDVVAIPKSVDPQRIEENLRAAQLQLSAAELAQIDQAFPPPRSRSHSRSCDSRTAPQALAGAAHRARGRWPREPMLRAPAII